MMARTRSTRDLLNVYLRTSAVLIAAIACSAAGCSKDDDAKSNDRSPTEAPSPIDLPEPEPLDTSSAGDVDTSGAVVDFHDVDAADVTTPDSDDGNESDDGSDDAADSVDDQDVKDDDDQAAAGDDPSDHAVAIPAGWGRVKATAMFTGKDRPGRSVLKMNADAYCVAANKGKRVGSENWIVNSKMQVANVVVFVKEGADGEFDPPEAAATLDQNCCVYVPHVQTLMTEQPLTITNSDATLHNVHSLPTKQRPFNKAQPKKGVTDTITFKRPEFIKIKCDVHPWMSAYIAVFDHPFSAVTNKSGSATIDLPPGNYSIGAWHEETGELATQAVTIEDGKTTEITVQVK